MVSALILHVKRGLVFLLSSLMSVLHILGQIFALVFRRVPLSNNPTACFLELMASLELGYMSFLDPRRPEGENNPLIPYLLSPTILTQPLKRPLLHCLLRSRSIALARLFQHLISCRLQAS